MESGKWKTVGFNDCSTFHFRFCDVLDDAVSYGNVDNLVVKQYVMQ
ncbi:MAG: hypothetical protein IK058_00015 [Bacteroidales bacterium]|nr:hypothetical protein [Bacteroidales bacterium]